MHSTNTITLALVEDFIPVRTQLNAYFSANGFTILHEAANGQDFLDQLAAASSLPELCLLDLNMPVMDGFETARILTARYPSIKILAYSTNNQGNRVEKILHCGALGFVEKFCPPALIKNALLKTYQGQQYIELNEFALP